MKHTGMVLASLIGGALIGSAITALLTPHSGSEMRRRIKDFVEEEVNRLRTEFEQHHCTCDEHGHCACNE